MASAAASAAAAGAPPAGEQLQQPGGEEQPAVGLVTAYLDAPLPYTHDDWQRVTCAGCNSNKRCVAQSAMRMSVYI